MKPIRLILLTSLAIWSFNLIAFGQNKTFNQPKRLLLKGDKVKEDFDNAKLLKELFYPIGWSRDGKFAYYTEPPDEACGCYFAEIAVVDLKTDKKLWEKRYTGDMEKAENIRTYWRKSQKEFSKKLNQYGIQVPKGFSLAKMPLKKGNDTFKLDLFSDVSLDDDPYHSKGSVIVKLISENLGEKTIYEKKYVGENNAGVLAADIGGVLKSPFEERIAVILVNTVRGWEGPPHVTRVSIIGADLQKGFK